MSDGGEWVKLGTESLICMGENNEDKDEERVDCP